jgi:hypothetical protein
MWSEHDARTAARSNGCDCEATHRARLAGVQVQHIRLQSKASNGEHGAQVAESRLSPERESDPGCAGRAHHLGQIAATRPGDSDYVIVLDACPGQHRGGTSGSAVGWLTHVGDAQALHGLVPSNVAITSIMVKSRHRLTLPSNVAA